MILGCTPILGNLHMCKRCQDVHGPRVVENCVQSIGPSFAIFRILFPLVQASYQPSLQLGTNAVTSMQWLVGSTASCLWPVRGYIWILMFLGITMTFPQNGGFVWHDFSNQFHSSIRLLYVSEKPGEDEDFCQPILRAGLWRSKGRLTSGKNGKMLLAPNKCCRLHFLIKRILVSNVRILFPTVHIEQLSAPVKCFGLINC